MNNALKNIPKIVFCAVIDFRPRLRIKRVKAEKLKPLRQFERNHKEVSK
jgi:hypothetical protein